MKMVAASVGVVVALLLGLVVALAADQDDSAASSTAGLAVGSIPEPYRQLVAAAGQVCPEVSAPLIAAQLEAESNWNPTGVSPVGAQGIAQFMPATWAGYGTDANHDGTANPMDPADAIPAQARYMCALAAIVKPIAASAGQPLTDLILAAYNAGPGAVQATRGIPPFPETLGYVEKITQLITKYTATASAGSASVAGAWRDPVDQSVRGTPFHKPGPLWRWKGWHTGVDYIAATGTPVHAAATGTITEVGMNGDYGNHVIIDHGTVDGKRIQTLYAHLSAFAPTTTIDAPVDGGTLIGYVGQTGNVTGPHLHFEVRANWTGGADDSEFLDGWAWIDAHRNPPPANPGTGGGSTVGAAAVAFARAQLGVPYVYGGGGLTGPSTVPPSAQPGYDCSGLTRAAIYAATRGRTTLPRVTYDQVTQGTAVAAADRQPGDLVFFKIHGGSWDHVGLYIGNGQMIHAPRTGKNVEIVSLAGGYYSHLTTTTRRIG